MTRKLKFRYLLAIYLVVAVIAIVLGAAAFSQPEATWQSLLLNLSTEFLGVFLLFLLVNVVFLVDDWDLAERVRELVQKLERPSAQDFFRSPPNPDDLQKYIQNARRIDLCGVTLTVTLNRNFSNLRQRLFEGAQVRIMIIAPEGEPLEAAARRSESGSVDYYERKLEASLNDLAYLLENWESERARPGSRAGTLAVGLLPYTPAFGMMIFESGENDKTMFVEMYPHHKGYDFPPNFTLTPDKDGAWYDYFTEQFEAMWAHTSQWEGSKPADEGGG